MPEIKTALRAYPGVLQAAAAHGSPHSTLLSSSRLQDAAGQDLYPEYVRVDAEYFSVAELRFLAGAPWTEGEASDGQLVINQALAQLLGGVDVALGKTLRAGKNELRVVGVVADIWSERGVGPQAFVPLTAYSAGQQEILFRFSETLPDAPELQTQLQRVDPSLRVDSIRDPAEMLRTHLRMTVLSAWLAAALAALGVTLAVAGVFASSAQQARLRRTEFGVRLALGAWPQRLLLEHIVDALPALAIGIAAAAAMVGWGAPLLKNSGLVLPALSAGDALLASLLLGLVGVSAVALAARGEIMRSPWQSLRND